MQTGYLYDELSRDSLADLLTALERRASAPLAEDHPTRSVTLQLDLDLLYVLERAAAEADLPASALARLLLEAALHECCETVGREWDDLDIHLNDWRFGMGSLTAAETEINASRSLWRSRARLNRPWTTNAPDAATGAEGPDQQHPEEEEPEL